MHEHGSKERINTLLKTMQDKTLSCFLEFIFEEIGDKWWNARASRNNHHAYEGGLAYHSTTAATLGARIASHYNSLGIKVDTDLVVAGILIHDIGKIDCYEKGESVEAMLDDEYEHTNISRLFHHIPHGFRIVSELAQDFNVSRAFENHKISDERVNNLLHIILSHHGRRAWSSPVIPQFIEAYIVHAVEMMDSYVDKYNSGADVRTIYDGITY